MPLPARAVRGCLLSRAEARESAADGSRAKWRYEMRCGMAAMMVWMVAVAGTAWGDVYVSIRSGWLMTGDISEDGTTITPGVRVFSAEFGQVLDNFSDEPGYQAAAGTLDVGARWGVNILGAVRQWNGVDFSMVSGSTITMQYGPASVTTPTTDRVVSGFLAGVNPDGGFHQHYDYVLNTPASAGVYLLALQLRTDQAGVRASKAFWAVFNNGLSLGDHDAAVKWVEDNLAPSPSGWSVLGLAGVGARGRRARVRHG